MIFHLRYHIASLIAVFVALGIGILVGGVMVGTGDLIAGQKELVSSLEEEFNNLRSQNNELKRKNEEFALYQTFENKFNQAVLTILADDILKGYDIEVVFEEGDNVDSSQKEAKMLTEFLIFTGADIDSSEDSDSKDVFKILYLQEIEDIGEVQYKPSEINAAVAASDSRVKSLDKLKRKGISTVDNIDTVFGQVALLAVIKGIKGHFGIGETADKFMPELESVF